MKSFRSSVSAWVESFRKRFLRQPTLFETSLGKTKNLSQSERNRPRLPSMVSFVGSISAHFEASVGFVGDGSCAAAGQQSEAIVRVEIPLRHFGVPTSKSSGIDGRTLGGGIS